MTSHVLTEAPFETVIRVLRKTFDFCKFSDVYVKRVNKKIHENLQGHYEKTKFRFGYCNRASVVIFLAQHIVFYFLNE